ncbi:MAG: SDR family oxidoreductase [Pseudomonadota bacterium]
MDVADERAVRLMVADITKRHGRIDVVLNNAAIASMNHILLTPAKSADRMLSVNVTGTMLVCRDAAKVMIRRKYGRIVNFTTIVAPIALAGESDLARRPRAQSSPSLASWPSSWGSGASPATPSEPPRS